MHFKMSFAICSNFDQSKILSSSTGLKQGEILRIMWACIVLSAAENVQ